MKVSFVHLVNDESTAKKMTLEDEIEEPKAIR
jgi:hypothetical protein